MSRKYHKFVTVRLISGEIFRAPNPWRRVLQECSLMFPLLPNLRPINVFDGLSRDGCLGTEVFSLKEAASPLPPTPATHGKFLNEHFQRPARRDKGLWGNAQWGRSTVTLLEFSLWLFWSSCNDLPTPSQRCLPLTPSVLNIKTSRHPRASNA